MGQTLDPDRDATAALCRRYGVTRLAIFAERVEQAREELHAA